MARGLDSPFSLAGQVDQLVQDGITYVARYYCTHGFKTCLHRPEVEAYERKVSIVSIFEDGQPNTPGYFTAARGTRDGQWMRMLALAAGQPIGTDIYATVDYDASPEDLPAIGAYWRAMREALRHDDHLVYFPEVYGNGLVCKYLTEQGLVHRTWLAAGRKMRGHDEWKPKANIVQIDVDQRYHGIDVDDDVSNGNGGGWKIAV